MARAVATASYWQPALPDTTLVDRAILVASELVTNAVVHVRTDLRLRLELRGDWLHIALESVGPVVQGLRTSKGLARAR